jgi:hypothetical protein
MNAPHADETESDRPIHATAVRVVAVEAFVILLLWWLGATFGR